MPWVHGDWIDEEDAGNAPPSRWSFAPYVRQLFVQAGWRPLPPPAPEDAGDAMARAASLLQEFGGLDVGASGSGIEHAAGNLEFFAQPMPLPASHPWLRRWPGLHDAVAIAEACDTYVVVFLAADGRFLCLTDVDVKLYDCGADFVRFAETTLRGLAWPLPMAA